MLYDEMVWDAVNFVYKDVSPTTLDLSSTLNA